MNPELDKIKVFCMNLDARPDRWVETREEMGVLGLEVERFPSVKRSPGWEGCRLSYLSLWEKVKHLGVWMIVEDDILFLPGAEDNLKKALAQLPEDWDLLYLGATLNEPLERVSDNLLKIKKGYTTHGIVYNNQNGVIDYILSKEWDWHIDRLLSDIIQEEFNCFMCYPMVATQRPGYSDIMNRHAEYNIIMNRYKKYVEKYQA